MINRQILARSSLLLLLCGCPQAFAEAQLDVRIKPANSALKANVEAYIGELGERDAQALQRLRRSAEVQATQALQALGYYHPQIQVHVREGEKPRLRVDIQPGEPVRIREVSIRVEGPASRLKAFKLPSAQALQTGAVLNHGAYEEAKKYILNQSRRYGFFDGRFTRQSLRIDPHALAADIDLIYDSGERYSLGAVRFSGDSPLEPALLERMVQFEPGIAYNSRHISQLNQDLLAIGYFDGVRVDANPADAQDRQIPVEVHLNMRKPRSMGAGVGFSTDVGPRVKFDWTQHWLNPQGHRLGFESELSGPRQNLGAWYDIPLDPPLTDKLRFTSGLQREDLVDTESQLVTLGSEWHHKHGNGWQRVVSLNWQEERYKLGNEDGRSMFLMPGLGYSLLRSDGSLDPGHGYRLQFDVSAAKEDLLSDANMARVSALAKGVTSFAGGHRLLGRVQLGGIATNQYDVIPPSLRFFAGGDQSVRGYDYQTLSPRNSDGDKVGGRYLMAGSLEYQYPLAERWRLATFVDQGNAVNSLKRAMKTGVGLGVRWISPVGPIRIDLAHALDDDQGFRLHFSMGPEL